MKHFILEHTICCSYYDLLRKLSALHKKGRLENGIPVRSSFASLLVAFLSSILILLPG